MTEAQWLAYSRGIGGTVEPTNLPAVQVSYEDAVGYCSWLTGCLRAVLVEDLEVDLPTEAEWECAMRGRDGLLFPWGDEWISSVTNAFDYLVDDEVIGGTSPVGMFPGATSPFGVADGAGNVWEWTSTPASRSFGVGAGRVVRGGSFWDSTRMLRAACRSAQAEGTRRGDLGFRVVVRSNGRPFAVRKAR